MLKNETGLKNFVIAVGCNNVRNKITMKTEN
jgi:hypothetical protein